MKRKTVLQAAAILLLMGLVFGWLVLGIGGRGPFYLGIGVIVYLIYSSIEDLV